MPVFQQNIGTVFILRSILAVVAFLFSATGWAVSITDVRGRLVELQQPASRIISLAPDITELLFAAGAGDSVVGVVEYSDYPPEALRITRIGNASRIDIEAILSLKPDLVISWRSGNSARDIEALERFGIKVFAIESSRLDDIPLHLANIAMLADTRADSIIEQYNIRLQQLRSEYLASQQVSVFYQVWDKPLMTINRRHLINDAITLCGGRNIFADIDTLVPTVSEEAVLVENPAVIISTEDSQSKSTRSVNRLDRWYQWKMLDAVKNGHLYTVPSALMTRATPRILDGVENLCGFINKARP
ncbi:MAG: cobalamin-binding protein [Gammaproteobacteria bacterium]